MTAGNAAGVNDAGAAVIVMSSRKAEELGAPVRARILSWAVLWRGAEGDGDRARAGGAAGAPESRQDARRRRRDRAERGVRGSVPRSDQGPRPRPGEGEPQRRRDRARSPDRATGAIIPRRSSPRWSARTTSSGSSRSASAAARASRCCSGATEPGSAADKDVALRATATIFDIESRRRSWRFSKTTKRSTSTSASCSRTSPTDDELRPALSQGGHDRPVPVHAIRIPRSR